MWKPPKTPDGFYRITALPSKSCSFSHALYAFEGTYFSFCAFLLLFIHLILFFISFIIINSTSSWQALLCRATRAYRCLHLSALRVLGGGEEGKETKEAYHPRPPEPPEPGQLQIRLQYRMPFEEILWLLNNKDTCLTLSFSKQEFKCMQFI